MPLEIQCPHCRRKFRVPEKYAGKRVKCPQCEGTIGIPAAGGPPSEGTVSGQEAAPDQAGSGQPTAQRWYHLTIFFMALYAVMIAAVIARREPRLYGP